jgi:hypothetical protein
VVENIPMSLPLLPLNPNTSAPKRLRTLPFERLNRQRVDLPELDPPATLTLDGGEVLVFRGSMMNLADFKGEVIIERTVGYGGSFDDDVVFHESIDVVWDMPGLIPASEAKIKRNFGRVLDLFYKAGPNVMSMMQKDGTYSKPIKDFRAELFTPQQWFDAFDAMGWNAHIEQDDYSGVERTIVSRAG